MLKPYSKEEEAAYIFLAVFSEHTVVPDDLLVPACPVLFAQGCLGCWGRPLQLGQAQQQSRHREPSALHALLRILNGL